MARFQADFTTYPVIVYAPAKVSFNNKSSVGKAINDSFTEVVDTDGNTVELINKTIDEIEVNAIDRFEWEFGDNQISVEENPDHIYEYTNLYPVKLTIYSSLFYDSILNKYLRVKNSVTKNIDVGSVSTAWLTQHMTQPHLSAFETSQGFKDLITSTSKLFDRMYKDIGDSVKLIDVKKVAPQFLEFFSDTLGHQRFYSKKIGYSVQNDDKLFEPFLSYDIFTRISENTASDKEIELFRQFILDTAKLFKENGSEQAMESFFKLYGFVTDIKEMWTTNFGTTSQDALNDNFFSNPVLQKSLNNFYYRGISVSGLDNNSGYIASNVSNLILDNYHFLTNHTYPSDYSSLNIATCETNFEINEIPPKIINVIRDDGRNITSKSTCGPFSVTLCPNDETDQLCTETDVRFSRNDSWTGVGKLTFGANTKIWRVRDNYVQTVINTVGLIPSGDDEAFEEPSNTNDDYLWADWNTGITPAPDIPGITESYFRKPSDQIIFTNVNLSTNKNDSNLISSELTTVDTSRDTYVVTRGFIKVSVSGYYNFFLDVGNTGENTNKNHVGLLSLKHKTNYSEEDIDEINSLNDIKFSRSKNDLQYVVDDGTTSRQIYGRESEYGIVELRQDEQVDDGYEVFSQDAGFYKLSPGYYAYEVKGTYNTYETKKLKLMWQIWDEVDRPTGTFFEVIQSKSIIPTNSLLTFDEFEKDIEDTKGKGIMTIPNELLEGADSLKVIYYNDHKEENNISGFVSRDKEVKDFEISIRLSPTSLSSTDSILNLRNPKKQFGIIFRGINNLKDLYSNVDSYYSFMFNGRLGEYSLAHVSYEEEINDIYFRYLNLNKNSTNLDKREFTKYLTDEYNHIVELEDDTFYDFKLKVENNKVYAYYRKNDEFTNAVLKIQQSTSINLLDYDSTVDEWVTLLDGISLEQDDVQTETFDKTDNNIEIPQKYKVIDEKGTYGLFVIDSIFKINKFSMNSLDKEDYNRVITTDKWKQIKPKYFDGKLQQEIQYNSYDIDNINETPISPTFKVKIIDDYQGESREILPSYLGKLDDNSVNRVFADGVNASDMGTRLNILFNSDYLNERFSETEDVLNSICIPFGEFFDPYIDWAPVKDTFNYMPYAGYSRIIAEDYRVLPHTISVSRDTNNNLNKEFITTLTRDSDDSTILKLDTILNEFIKATNEGSYGGMWEEVMPYSASETFDVPTLGTVENEVFEIIKRGNEKIGVQIKSKDAFEKIQCRYCENAIIWGLYELTFDESSITNLPEYLKTLLNAQIDDLTLDELSEMEIECILNNQVDAHPFEDACDTSGLALNKIRYFIPIGKLDENYLKFVPAAGILENKKVEIELLGVYAHLDIDNFVFNDSTDNIQFTISTINDFEKQYKSKVQCNYYVDFSMNFINKLEKYNNSVIRKNIPEQCDPGDYLYRDSEDKPDENGCVDYVSNAYFMPETIVKIVKYLENKYPVSENNLLDSNFTSEFNWWIPEELWVERKFTLLIPENTDTHLFTGFSDIGNEFYGQEIEKAGLKISLNDGFDADIGTYQFNGEWCVSSVGWDTEYFSVPDISGSFENVDVGEKLTAPIPLETVETSGQNYLLLGSNYNKETNEKRTFSPTGLFNWFQTHSNGISGSEQLGWEVSDWNEESVNCFSLKNIYSPIDDSNYEINKYWGFYQESIPPTASRVNVVYKNRNCYEVDGENAPEAIEYDILLGISDGYNAFYAVPPLIEQYPSWIKKVEEVSIDNYTFNSDEYYVSENTELADTRYQFNLQTDVFSFNKFINSDIYLDFFYDKLFDLNNSTILTDDFGNNRDINWITLIDNDKYYNIGKREIDAELKYTNLSLPYNIKTYKNNDVYQALDKFDVEDIDTISGTKQNEKRQDNIVGFDENRGFRNVISLVDSESNNYTLSCDFIFDKDMVNYKDKDRKFELILKAENNYTVENKDWGVTDFYYVGVGTNNFDIGLGMRSLDSITNNVKETFLASFGDFNLRNINLDTWYTLKAEVLSDRIKIFFNKKGEPERLVLNYNIDKKYEKLTERYLKGEFETLQSVIIGLEELDITYPNTLSNKVSADYTFDNFKEEFAGTLPVEGQYCGFRIFNDMTYVGKVKYEALLPKKYRWGSAYDGKGFNELLYKIVNNFNIKESAEIVNMDATLNGFTFVQIDNDLFYRKTGNDPEKYINKVYKFEIVKDKIIIVEKEKPENSAIGINRWVPGKHTFTWSLEPGTNNYDATLYSELIKTIPNIQTLKIDRTFENGNVVTREIGYVSGMTGEISGTDSKITVGDEVTVTIGGDRPIYWPLDGEWSNFKLFVRAYQEGFTKEYPILIRDKTFYTDSLKKYLNITDKSIKNVYINDDMLHLIFEDDI